MAVVLTTVEMTFRTAEAEAEFQKVFPQMEQELGSIPGMLESRTYRRGPGTYLFFNVWESAEAIQRWVDNEFHRTVLMPSFRQWCSLGWFGYWDEREDHPRSKKCMACGRWTRAHPGWDAGVPDTCRNCGAKLE